MTANQSLLALATNFDELAVEGARIQDQLARNLMTDEVIAYVHASREMAIESARIMRALANAVEAGE